MSKRVLGREYRQVTATGMFYLTVSGSGISIYDTTVGGFFCFLHIFLEMIFFKQGNLTFKQRANFAKLTKSKFGPFWYFGMSSSTITRLLKMHSI